VKSAVASLRSALQRIHIHMVRNWSTDFEVMHVAESHQEDMKVLKDGGAGT
jgi:Na+-translocating ferredoxin:NAD+ oxidoreductase RnfG subunit